VKHTLLLAFLPLLAFAQSSPQTSSSPPPAEATPGIAAEWDVRKSMTALAEQTKGLQPLLDRVKPEEWVSRGAPDAYGKQLNSAKTNLQYLVYSTDKLAHEPERLTLALDAYFRMQSMEMLLNSLRDGVQKYQPGALSNELSSAVAENSNGRERLRSLISDLASAQEQEFQVLNQEAQRCRGMIIKQPAGAGSDRSQYRKSEKK
jgi:hypothetical protein